MDLRYQRRAHAALVDAECWQRARGLVQALHGREELALHITLAATSRLETACRRQKNRRRYRPKSGRRKVTMEPAQLLQQLVLEESEHWERMEEEAATVSLGKDVLLVRYVKHLVQISMSRNLLHVIIAICRILYGYSTRDALAIHDRLVGDRQTAPEPSYFRARKRVLVCELLRRFGPRLEVERTALGELAFRGGWASRRHNDLVESTLRRLTPWQTACSSARDSAGTADVRQGVLSEDQGPGAGSQPRSRGACEMFRIHQLLHPPCLRQLTRSLGIADPTDRLQIPQFL